MHPGVESSWSSARNNARLDMNIGIGRADSRAGEEEAAAYGGQTCSYRSSAAGFGGL